MSKRIVKSKSIELAPYVSVQYSKPRKPPLWIRSEEPSIDYLKIVSRELADTAGQFDLSERREWREITSYEVVTHRWNIDRKKIEEVLKEFKKRRLKFKHEKKLFKLLEDSYKEHYLSLF